MEGKSHAQKNRVIGISVQKNRERDWKFLKRPRSGHKDVPGQDRRAKLGNQRKEKKEMGL